MTNSTSGSADTLIETGHRQMDPPGRQLRTAFGAFPTGVVVVTALHQMAGALGMTMSSFTSISLDPPVILFSIDRRAASLPAWLEVSGYAVNVLARDQQDLSNRFARPLSEKWRGLSFERGLHGAPLIKDALACFECSAERTLSAGDHVIFLARVDRFVCNERTEPLVFHRGRYRSLTRDDAGDLTTADWPLPIHY